MAGSASDDNPIGINVTAMVDIIFCLCLFFMCSLKFNELDGILDSWLPKDKGPRSAGPPKGLEEEELRIILSYDVATRSVQRLFVARPIPKGKDGDEMLRVCVRSTRQDLARLGLTEIPVIIDSGPAVPWDEVVRVMDLCRSENVARIELARGSS